MTGTPIIKKVPGNLVKFEKEKDGYVDLSKLSRTELLDLHQREANLLKNKKFLDKLPDKGEKIHRFYGEIQTEMKKRDEHEKLCGLLANLNVNESKDVIDKLEWTGKVDVASTSIDVTTEDEIDPLRILVTHSGTSSSKQKQIMKKSEEDLVKASDISVKSDNDLDNVEFFAKELCHRFDSAKKYESRNKFFTHKSLNVTSVKDLIGNKEPDIKSSNSSDNLKSKSKMLSLQESLIIQQQQMKYQKELEMQHALEKLMNKTSYGGDLPEDDVNEYREPTTDSEDETNSVTTNEDDDEKDTAVYYNLVD